MVLGDRDDFFPQIGGITYPPYLWSDFYEYEGDDFVKKRCVVFFCFLIFFVALTGCGSYPSELSMNTTGMVTEIPSLPVMGNIDDLLKQPVCKMSWLIDDSVFARDGEVTIWDICKSNYYDLWRQISKEIFKDSTIIKENQTVEYRSLTLDNGIVVNIFEDYLVLKLANEQVYHSKYNRSFVEMVLTFLPVCTGFDLLDNGNGEYNFAINGIPLDQRGYGIQDGYIPGAQVMCEKDYLGEQTILISTPYILVKEARDISSKDFIPIGTIKQLCVASFSNTSSKPVMLSFNAAEFVYFMKNDTQQLSPAWYVTGNILYEDEFSIDVSLLIDAITGEVYR